MSIPKQISPMLDGCLLGEAISDHHGVRCYPVIREETGERFILKIISVPATASQLDAMLLTGACSDTDQALAYFKELAEGILQETEILQQLGNAESYEPYVSTHLEQREDGTGFDINLLSPYRPSLKTVMHAEPLTQSAAVHLGLDLCAALAAARRAGYLYVDLKPDNIYLTDDGSYRIGDLGFIPLSSLPYASLPEKYRSQYTAPEIGDALSALTDTIDIYALGLVLYQLYNNCALPYDGQPRSDEIPAPLYADYELAHIITKACAVNPADRWADPVQMGQALVDYMQRYGVSDLCIIPEPIVIEDAQEEFEPFLTEEENDEEFAHILAAIGEEEPPRQLIIDGADFSEEAVAPAESTEDQSQSAVVASENPDDQQLSFLDENGVSGEFSQIMALADDLMAHQPPEPVSVPDPIDVPVPPLPEADPEPEPEDEITGDDPEQENEEDDILYGPPSKRISVRIIALVSAVLLLLSAIVAGVIWYREIYLQPVEMLNIFGSGNELRIDIVSDIEDSLLTVVCTDTYGNTHRSPVSGGFAEFKDLSPATQYRIRLEISGLHKLTGQTTGTYTTDKQTAILNFSAVCGPEDGSVILNFSVNGPDSDQWSVVYTTDGEPEQTQSFSGHTVTLFGLTPDKTYTFRLDGGKDIRIAGGNEITYTAQELLTAEDLKVTEWNDGRLTVQWQAPNAPAGQKWLLRCYNDAGVDINVTTEETTYTFTGLDQTAGYTVLVTADGMTGSRSTSVTANPINVTGYTATVTAPWELSLTWEFTGAAPAGGWVLRMTLDSGREITLNCPENTATIALIPGCVYSFTAEPADDITFFTQAYSFTAEAAVPFQGYGITAVDLTASMVLRPGKQNWGSTDLTADSYKTEFSNGELASVLLRVGKNFSLSADEVTITFAVRNSNAQLVSSVSKTAPWNSLWKGVYCPLDLPAMPTEPGTYTLDLYFNGLYVTGLQFYIM